MKQNTPRQKKNCLQNFDLSEHRQILSDLAIHIYHQFITIMEKSLTPAIGILQFNSLYLCIIKMYCCMHILTMVSFMCFLDHQYLECWNMRAYRGFPA